MTRASRLSRHLAPRQVLGAPRRMPVPLIRARLDSNHLKPAHAWGSPAVLAAITAQRQSRWVRPEIQQTSSDIASVSLDAATKRQVVILSASQFVVNASFGIVVPVLPQLAGHLGLGAAGVGLILTAPAITRLMFNIPAGMLTDSVGRVPMMVFGMLGSAISSVGTALASTVYALVASRLLVGVSSAASLSGSQAYMADITDRVPLMRARIMGLQQVVVTGAFIVGPAFGGWIAELYGHQVAFYTVAGFMVVTMLGYSLLPETLVKGKVQTQTSLTEVMRNWRHLLRSPAQQAIAALNFGVFAGYATMLTIVPLHAAAVYGAGAASIGTLFAAVAGLGLIGAPLGGWLADRLGHKIVIIPSVCFIVTGVSGLALADSLPTFYGFMALWGLGNSLTLPGLSAFTADQAPDHWRGQALALARQAGDAAFLVCPILMGLMAESQGIPLALGATALVVGGSNVVFALRAPRNAVPGVPTQKLT